MSSLFTLIFMRFIRAHVPTCRSHVSVQKILQLETNNGSAPNFTPSLSGPLLVVTHQIEFQWFPGISVSQAQKSIDSLHKSACEQLGTKAVLEISSKSKDPAGVRLSAFNLMVKTGLYEREFSLECAFQSSKVFEHGGPFKDLLDARSIDAKRDERLSQHGRLTRFEYFGADWPLEPRTAFYDWLYINALHKQPELADIVLGYAAFSDIAFNPQRSINCQAYAAALYVSLHKRGLLSTDVLNDQAAYLKTIDTGAVSNAD